MKSFRCPLVSVIASLVLAVNACKFAAPKEYSIERDFDCNSTWLSRPFYFDSYNPLFKKCFIEVGKVGGSEDTLPTIEWKTYLCVLNASSAFPKGNVNFEAYVNFMTSKYPDEFSKNIKNAVKENCTKVDDESEEWGKVMKYAQCFYRNEEQVCVSDRKIENSTGIENTIETKCETLPGSSSLGGCCKDKPTPIDLSRLVGHFLVNSSREAEKVPQKDFEECQKTISDRQQKLQEGLNSSQSVYTDMCEFSCAFRPQKYIDMKSLKLNFTDEIENHALELLPKALRLKIKEIIPKYKKSLQYEIRDQDYKSKLITHGKHVEQFNAITDELEKIRAYCDIPRYFIQFLSVSFSEYCLGPDTVKTIYKEFLVDN